MDRTITSAQNIFDILNKNILAQKGYKKGDNIPNTGLLHLKSYRDADGNYSVISAKQVKSIMEMPSQDTIILEYKSIIGNRGYIMLSKNGSKGMDVIYSIGDEFSESIYSTNINSHLMFTFLLFLARIETKNERIDEAISDLKEKEEGTWKHIVNGKMFFDSNTSEPIATITYNVAKSFINSKVPVFPMELETGDTFESIIKDMGCKIENDYTPYINPYCDRSYVENFISNLGEIPLKSPENKFEIKAKAKQKLKEYNNKDYSIYSNDEIDIMDDFLKSCYLSAKREFEYNKEFLTDFDWRTIAALNTGRVRSLCFLGPAGTGKTTMSRTYAGALNMPFILVGGSAGVEEASLFGSWQLRESESGNGTVMKWVDGPLTIAIRNGAFVLFDEENAANPGVIMKLNSILDNSKTILLDSGELVSVHPNFRFAAAMNIGSGYEGTGKLNLSHLDRFNRIIKIKAKNEEDMAEIVAKRTGYNNKKQLVKMARISKSISQHIKDGDGDASEMITSIRRIIDWVLEAEQTGEFVTSSLNTILSYLCVYDDSIEEVTEEDLMLSDGLPYIIYSEIMAELGSEVFEYDKFNKEEVNF